MLVLVRHAMPLIDPDADPATWPLSPAGEAAARAAGHLIPAGAVLVSSDEPKAYQTLAAATGGPVIAEPGLREVARPIEPYADDFATARLAYVAGDPPPDWEPPAAVVARVDAAIARHHVQERDLVMAGHGMAFTTWLAAHGLVDDPQAFWRDLRLPDVLAVDGGRVHRR